VPRTAKGAYALDKKNGNTFWADAIVKEMKEVSVAFRILPDGEIAPIERFVAWGLTPSKYVNAAVKNIEQSMTEKLDGSYVIPHNPANPFTKDYCPELAETTPLEPSHALYFMHLIGVMW
jgi:hypothetical protein